jgi:translation initiation factor 5B
MAATTLRGPICTIAGHVDAGKTATLDILRQSRVADGEPGGITQKMGVTRFTKERMVELTKAMNKPIGVNGIYFIDTPGHECFTNQRLCGIEISDIVVIVVDIFKGIEKQTIECIKLLQRCNTPFIVAVNKVDRIDGWISKKLRGMRPAIKGQSDKTRKLLEGYLNKLFVSFAENEVNVSPYYENKDPKEYVMMVPISAKTGEGIPDLLMVINVLTTKFLAKRLTIKDDIVRGFIIEKFRDPKYGDIVAAILTDGMINAGDELLMFDNHNNVIDNRCRLLMVPEANKEVKDKFSLTQIQKIDAAASIIIKLDNPEIRTGVRFCAFKTQEEKANLLENMVVRSNKELERDFVTLGIFIVAPTLGMADALFNLCASEKIPVAGIHLGPINKKCIIIAANVIGKSENKDDELFNARFGVILAYDTEISKEVEQMATASKVKIVSNNIIYRLIETYHQMCTSLNNEIIKRHPSLTPMAELSIFEEYIFMTRNPILIGVRILKNKIRKGMVLEAVQGDTVVILGPIISIQKNRKDVDEACKDEEVCIRIDTKVEYGEEFDHCYKLRTSYSDDDRMLIKSYGSVLGLN